MSSLYFPRDSSYITESVHNVSDSFHNQSLGELRTFLATRCKDPFIQKLFQIAIKTQYLEETRLDYPFSIHISPDQLFSICKNRDEPIHWSLNSKSLSLILKIQDVKTAKIWTTYFLYHYNENSDTGTTCHLDSLFSSVPPETMLANFEALVHEQTITICPEKDRQGFRHEYQCVLANSIQ